jgi:hypothetical protein
MSILLPGLGLFLPFVIAAFVMPSIRSREDAARGARAAPPADAHALERQLSRFHYFE